jgi:D-sedoheptulose 7-phosphate isomerase
MTDAALPTLAAWLAESAEAIVRAGEVAAQAERAAEAMITALRAGGRLLVCGNGGSAADAMHISAELVGRFRKTRPAIACLALGTNPATLSAWGNDMSFAGALSREVAAYGRPGDVLLAISTSGASENVLQAAAAARGLRLAVVGLTGSGGGELGRLSDILVAVPAQSTPVIQQVHACIWHWLCARIESELHP